MGFLGLGRHLVAWRFVSVVRWFLVGHWIMDWADKIRDGQLLSTSL